ncbi:MAG: DUF4190 domain-containing protein [Candidatus Omnitrophota bacterium]
MTELQKKTLGLAIASLVCGLFFLIPLLGMLLGIIAIILGIIALVQISKNKETLKGNGLAITGIVLGAISIFIVPIFALMAAIAIPNLLRARLSANEALAQSTVRAIAIAANTFQTANQRFPQELSELTQASPAYINQDYADGPISGYEYRYFNPLGGETFMVTAKPVEPGASGTYSYCIMSDGIVRGDPEGKDIYTTYQCEAFEETSSRYTPVSP